MSSSTKKVTSKGDENKIHQKFDVLCYLNNLYFHLQLIRKHTKKSAERISSKGFVPYRIEMNIGNF